MPFHALAAQLEPGQSFVPQGSLQHESLQVEPWGCTGTSPSLGAGRGHRAALLVPTEEQHWHGHSFPFPRRGARALPIFRQWDFLGNCSLSSLCPGT